MIGAAIRTASGLEASGRGRERDFRVRLLAGLLMLTAALLLSGASAHAGTGVSHPHLFTATPISSIPGPPVELQARSLGVDEAQGRLYVSVSRFRALGNIRDSVVQVFDASTGAFISTLDLSKSPSTLTTYPREVILAVDNSGGPSQGRIYIGTCTPFAKNNQSEMGHTCASADEPNGTASHGIIEIFDSTGEYVGRLDGSGTAKGPYPSGSLAPFGALEVDGDGNLYVGRTDGSSIDKFDSSGKFLGEISKPQINAPMSLAFDSTGGFYASNFSCQGIVKFNSAGVFQGSLAGSASLDVDTSNDDLYTTSGGLFLSQYDSAGNLLGNFGGTRVEELFSGGTHTVSLCAGSVAVDSSTGRIYATGKGRATVEGFGPGVPGTTPDVATQPATDIGYYTVTLNGKVNPNGEPTSYRFQYDGGTQGVTASQNVGSGTEEIEVSVPITLATPLSQDAEFNYRLIATNTDDDVSSVSGSSTFKTEAVPPPTLDPPTGVTSSSVHVSGTVNPQGLDTTWRFELSDGKSKSGNAGSGTSDTPVSADFSGLEPNTQYEVTLSAQNAGGSVQSSPLQFTTPAEKPVAITIPAGCLQDTSVCVGAAIDARKSATDYYFEYGTDETYGSFAPPAKDGDAGTGLGLEKIVAQLFDLQPDTVYHYRVVAENQAGKVTSPDATFETRSATSPFGADWPARGFELVSPPDKGNQPVEGLPVGSPRTSPAGDRVVWKTFGGGPLSTTGGFPPYLSIRTPDGWSTRTLAPPASEQPLQGRANYIVDFVSPDLSLFVVDQNTQNEPGAILRIDDAGNQSQLGPAFPEGSRPPLGSAATADARRLVMPNPDESEENFLEFSEEGLRKISVPTCGHEPIARLGVHTGSYPWLAPKATRIFIYSSGTGPCNVPLGVYRIEAENGDTELVSGAHTSTARFVRTNDEGTVAIYTKAGEIYRWDEGAGSSCLTCFTGGTGIRDDSVVASPDLDLFYFQAPKQLVAGEGITTSSCATQTTCNTYVLQDGEIHFLGITSLPYLSGLSLSEKAMLPSGNRVDPSADYGTLAFLSSDPFTTADPTSGMTQLYRYEADTGRVECVSCDGSTGPTEGSIDHPGEQNSTPFAISGDGQTIAFTTTAPLSSRDVNRTRDVYEWHEGFVRLVTDGVSEISDASFGYPEVWGVGSDGRNLIFSQRGRLVGNESDALSNLYNARLGGGTVLPEPPAPCVEDACQGPLEAPPLLSNPGSAAFSGPANERRTQKKKARKKKKSKVKQRKGQRKHAKRASRNRGGQK